MLSDADGASAPPTQRKRYVKVTNVGEAITAMNMFGSDASRSGVVVDGAELIRPPRYKKADTGFFAPRPALAEEPCTACGAPWESEDGYFLSSGRHSRRCVFCLTSYCSVCKTQFMEPHTSSLLFSNHAWACKGAACRAAPAVQSHWAAPPLPSRRDRDDVTPRGGSTLPPPRLQEHPSLAAAKRRHDDAVLQYAARTTANAAGMPGSTEPLAPRHRQEYCDL